jgi:hypothetical protein
MKNFRRAETKQKPNILKKQGSILHKKKRLNG